MPTYMIMAWLTLGVVMFDMVYNKVKKIVGRTDDMMSVEERDRLAQSLGYADWQQYVHYEISLPVEWDAANYRHAN